MKKILSLILILLMLPCSMQGVGAASTTKQESTIKAMEMLQFMDIVQKEYNNNNFNPEQIITRANFAVYFSKMMNIQNSGSGTLYYTDVPKTHYAFDAVTAMTENNYLNGVGDKTFEPDRPMKKDDAQAAFIKALGYIDYSEYSAEIQRSIADSKEILKGTEGGSTLNLNDLIIMMKNTLLAKTTKMTGLKNGAPVWEDGESLLYVTRKMEYVKNETMTGARGTSIYGTALGVDKTEIGEKLYKTAVENAFDYIGSKVDYIYLKDDNGDDDEVVWIQKNDTAEELFLNRENDIEYNRINNSLTYYNESGKKKTEFLSSEMSVIYNGAFTDNGYADIFGSDAYEVTLHKTNNSSKWNLAVVWEYEDRFVAETNKSEMTVYDSLTQTSLSLDPGHYDVCEIVNSAGDKLAFEDISPKTVLSTYVSRDNRYIKAVVSTNVVSGAYTSSSSIKGIEVDGKFYKFHKEDTAEDLSGVKSMTLYLDHNGYIAKAVKSFVGANQFVGYVYKFTHYTEAEDMLAMKVLSEDGTLGTYIASDKLNIDGVQHKNIQSAYSAVVGGSKYKPQIMCLTLNEDGKITRIDRTAENGGKGTVIRMNRQQPTVDEAGRWEAVYYTQAQSAGLDMLIGPETTIFYVPEDEDIETAQSRDFGIGVPANNDDFRNAVSYATTPEEVFTEQYIVLKQETKSTPLSEYDGFFLVDSVIETVDNDGMETKAIIGMQQGNSLTLRVDSDVFDFFANSSLKDVKSGDIIRISHKNGIINNAAMIYSYGSGEPVSVEANAPAATERFVSGHVYSKEGNIFKLTFENSSNDWDQITNMNGMTANIMVYDSKNRDNRVYKGSVSDMKTYKDSGEGSFVVMQTRYMRTLGLVIYK